MNEDSRAGAIWSQLRVTPQLAADFVVTFARFEYALKRSRYLRGDAGRAARPNWDGFASYVQNQCSSDHVADLLRAAAYLVSHPALPQLVGVGCTLDWGGAPSEIRDVRGLLPPFGPLETTCFTAENSPSLRDLLQSRFETRN